MTRLGTIRTYFIERFFELLTTDFEFAKLREPKELFAADGSFNVSMTAAGFARIPTLAGVDARIAAATTKAQKMALRKFRDVLERTLVSLFGSLASETAASASALARCFAPVIRHPDSQAFWPVDTGRLLKFDDGSLRGSYQDANARQDLAGNLIDLMLENPVVWGGAATAAPPFEARIPFVATVGLDGTVPGFPDSPLTDGHLNLPAADARLTPGFFQPTLFAEMKPLRAAVENHAHYAATAAGGGRFTALRGNRTQWDPVAPFRDFQLSSRFAQGDVMLLFHAFYPVDDGHRRNKDGTGTNREFHHLAVGLLLPSLDSEHAGIHAKRAGLLFLTDGPTRAKVLPMAHPALAFVDDGGNESAGGTHAIVYATNRGVQSLSFSGSQVDSGGLTEVAEAGTDFDPDTAEWWLGLAGAAATGALAGLPAGPIGAAVGAIVGALLFLLIWALKKLFGGSDEREEEWTAHPALGQGQGALKSYGRPESHDIAPPGATPATGGTKPARAYEMKLIPHLPDDNLYGLDFAGGDLFRIVERTDRTEMLAWHAFPGGIGYQFDRPAPGRTEEAGTSIQNYFTLFLRKMHELQHARGMVTYFDA
jgi:hypothetical protein